MIIFGKDLDNMGAEGFTGAWAVMAGAFSALFGGGVVAGIHRQKITSLERRMEHLDQLPERLATLETKMDLIIELNGGNAPRPVNMGNNKRSG